MVVVIVDCVGEKVEMVRDIDSVGVFLLVGSRVDIPSFILILLVLFLSVFGYIASQVATNRKLGNRDTICTRAMLLPSPQFKILRLGATSVRQAVRYDFSIHDSMDVAVMS